MPCNRVTTVGFAQRSRRSKGYPKAIYKLSCLKQKKGKKSDIKNTKGEIVLYKALSKYRSTLQGVRALKHKRKAYTIKGKVLTLALESKGFQGNKLAILT